MPDVAQEIVVASRGDIRNCARMNDKQFVMEPRFSNATSAMATVMSCRRDRVVHGLGAKTFRAADVGAIPTYPRIVCWGGLVPHRFAKERATSAADRSCTLKVGHGVGLHLRKTPLAVGYFETHHVAQDRAVGAIWSPIPYVGLPAMREGRR